MKPGEIAVTSAQFLILKVLFGAKQLGHGLRCNEIARVVNGHLPEGQTISDLSVASNIGVLRKKGLCYPQAQKTGKVSYYKGPHPVFENRWHLSQLGSRGRICYPSMSLSLIQDEEILAGGRRLHERFEGLRIAGSFADIETWLNEHMDILISASRDFTAEYGRTFEAAPARPGDYSFSLKTRKRRPDGIWSGTMIVMIRGQRCFFDEHETYATRSYWGPRSLFVGSGIKPLKGWSHLDEETSFSYVFRFILDEADFPNLQFAAAMLDTPETLGIL